MSDKVIKAMINPELKGMDFDEMSAAATPYHDIAVKREHDFAKRVPYLEDVFVRALMYYLQSKRDMTPGSKLLDEGLARDLLEEREILELGDEIDKIGGRGFQGQRKIADYRSRLKKRRARKKEFDPEDQDQVAQKEYEKRGKKGSSAREDKRAKKMTNFERTLKMRKKLEDMIGNDSGKD